MARPSASGPIVGGRHSRPFGAMPESLATEYGYVEEEHFLTGTASAYDPVGEWGSDGRWQVAPTAPASYTTRVVVRRPADPARFDGTAVVEWLNVSSGQDSDVTFAHAHRELLAHGTVWIGVSAQSAGVEAGGVAMPMPGLVATPLKTWDPERYGPLAHPGDDYSYDIYSQVAAALRQPTGTDLLAGGHVTTLIAAGESQSAARMVTYVNAVHPVADIYDAFLIHSRGSGGAALRIGTAASAPFAWIRDDLEDEVFQFETETDLLGLSFVTARQRDTDLVRTWEVAGTAHLDRGMLDYFRDRDRDRVDVPAPPGGDPFEAACGSVNAGPQSAVLSRAISDLRRWATEGTAPAHGDPIEVRDGAVVRDGRGIALGGIRTPPVDAPTAVLRGDNPSAAGYTCSLFGSTTALDAATLTTLYPTHDDYVAAVTRSARNAVGRGHLLQSDADSYIQTASASNIPR